MYIERFSFVSPWPADSFKNELLNPISRIWGVLDGEAFVGFTCFWIVAGDIHLLNIAVAPEKRGRGIGRYLLGRVIELGENVSVDRIWLEVRPSNSAALALYRGAGFIEDGIRPGYYSDTGEDAVLMSLYLNPAADYKKSLNRPDVVSFNA
jgi:ribosomal-protein-alanine N-acetyltransferase